MCSRCTADAQQMQTTAFEAVAAVTRCCMCPAPAVHTPQTSLLDILLQGSGAMTSSGSGPVPEGPPAGGGGGGEGDDGDTPMADSPSAAGQPPGTPIVVQVRHGGISDLQLEQWSLARDNETFLAGHALQELGQP